MNHQQTMALRNLKAVCTNKRIDLFTLLSRYDSDRNGMVPASKFKEVNDKYKLIDNPASFLAITRLVQKGSLDQIDINLLQLYLSKAEDPSKFAYLEIVREMILNYARKNQTPVRKLFDKYNEAKKLSPKNFCDLLITCDLKKPDSQKIEDIMKEYHPTSQLPVMTIYDYLSIFQRETIEEDLMDMFRPYATMYTSLKAKLEMLGNSIAKHFYTVTSTLQLSFELMKFLDLPEGNTEAIKFCALLEDPTTGTKNVLDRKALEFVEMHLPKNFGNLVGAQQRPNAIHAAAPSPRIAADPSGLTIEELEKVKVGITQIDGVMRKALNQDYIGALQKYDRSKTGKISDGDFYSFLEQDLKLNVSKKKNSIDMLKRYAKKGTEGPLDYHHLWAIISTDLSLKKSQLGSQFQSESVVGDNSAPPAVPSYLRQDKPDNRPPIVEGGIVDSVADAALKHPVRAQILRVYRELGISKDNFINLMFPDSVRDLEKEKFFKHLMDTVKGLDPVDVNKYMDLSEIIKDKKYAQRDKFRVAIFEETGLQGDLKNQTMDQQIQSVFNAFRTGKDGLTMNQVGDACKRLGIYLSKPELDHLYRDFKKKDSSDMSEGDFNKLIKHEFSKEIIGSRVIGQRLTNLLDSILKRREDNIVNSQIQ